MTAARRRDGTRQETRRSCELCVVTTTLGQERKSSPVLSTGCLLKSLNVFPFVTRVLLWSIIIYQTSPLVDDRMMTMHDTEDGWRPLVSNKLSVSDLNRIYWSTWSIFDRQCQFCRSFTEDILYQPDSWPLIGTNISNKESFSTSASWIGNSKV